MQRQAPPWHHLSGLADLTLASAEKRHLVLVMAYTAGNVSWAADELGVAESTVYNMLRRHGLIAGRHLAERAELTVESVAV